MRPYRNPRIISVIRELYFGQGTASYAYRFEEYVGSFSSFNVTSLALKYTYRHFPTFRGDDGILRWEVPIPMVALVATAVSAATSI
jgi:hypothetical protein